MRSAGLLSGVSAKRGDFFITWMVKSPRFARSTDAPYPRRVVIAELWRYPVKSLAGERLEEAELRADGIAGDRSLMVFDEHGRFVTARTRPRLLGLNATIGPSGEPLIGGAEWSSPAAAAAVRDAAGAGARLASSAGHERRFDDTPVLIATDGAIDHLGVDGRRLRPNILVAGVSGLAERGWPGQAVRAGAVELTVERLCKRCVVTTFDPDSLAQDAGVLARINAGYDGRVALNCRVVRPGHLRVGDSVEVRPHTPR